MNKLKLYNTLSGKIEKFIPIDENNVRMYVCGPTVYDRAHIGNARPAVVFDVLYRILKTLYNKVIYVRNITDVDDKIYKAAKEKKFSIKDLTDKTIKLYHEDINSLNVLNPSEEPRATEHIREMIDLIEKLIQNKNAYVSQGHVYFDVLSFKHYGNLSKKNMNELLCGARIEVSNLKKNPLDFVLWKPVDENFDLGWESPWGKGRPGWHIECSAMSLKYLGEIFDIHGGGADLVFPHHENEIAQSCALTSNESMAKYWLHNGHLNINGTKMSKSLGNFFTVKELLEKFDGEIIRLTFLMTHYAAPMNFSFDSLNMAKNILNRWYNSLRCVELINSEEILQDVLDALLEDMNTPKAISIISQHIDDLNKTDNKNKHLATCIVNTCQNFLGILTKKPDSWFCDVCECEKQWIEKLIETRNEAKKMKEYAKADEIRKILLEKNIIIEDTKDATLWKKI